MSSAEDLLDAPDVARSELLAALEIDLGDACLASHLKPGDDLWIRVTRDAWVRTAQLLRERYQMTYFNFFSVIDWMPSPYGRELDAEADNVVHGRTERPPEAIAWGYTGGTARFQGLLRLNDVLGHRAVTVKVDIPDDDLSLPTLIGVFAGANWHEREAHEMFGIGFDGHPDLRNLYLPGAFEGYPLRKDFPLLARRIKPWPGIVDVEGMPGEPDDGDASGSDIPADGSDSTEGAS